VSVDVQLVEVAGRARPSGEDVAWVLADLAPALAGVRVLSVRASSEVLCDGDFRWGLGGVVVELHVGDPAHAARVAATFGLDGPQEQQVGQTVFWTWAGWMSEVGREFAICLTVTVVVC